ncbi:hypothetical protein ANO14919_092290 [Xylariales sp. No.14919]|nr:hypothetical protein ANO14919_092290 [Xylariales sp. No.14919]
MNGGDIIRGTGSYWLQEETNMQQTREATSQIIPLTVSPA